MSLRPESHRAQHSRRDKKIIQPNYNPNSFNSLNPDFSQFYNAVIPSQPLNFASPSSYGDSSSSSLANMSNPIFPDNWRTVDSSHQSYDWTMNNYAGGTSSSSVGNVLSRAHDLKPHYIGHGYGHDLQSFNEIPKQMSSDQMQFSYNHMNSSLQDVVTPTSLYLDTSNQWSNQMGLITRKHEQLSSSDTNAQGLSLSLSSNPTYAGNIVSHFGEKYESGYVQPKLVKSVGACSYGVRNVGPLGPFTGYATILKSSKFLKPAQDLLDELCNSSSGKHIPARICGELDSSLVSVSDTVETGAKGISNDCGIVPYSDGSIGAAGDVRMGSSSGELYRPECKQKKAKLLYLQEEVCRKQKQYQQQMQMVASSFEAVAGLSSATPYVSLALKTVSRNFRDLKHAISGQLKRVSRALGEDSLSPHVGDASTSKTRYMDPNLQRLKSGGPNSTFFEPHQHVWRPQRGLPERAVAILKAWLYDHFLHPYPNDTDKHMLANQTGLSRNQVSNWFINARVRVWKPMVEEIHMLETKGMAEASGNSGTEGKSADCTSQPSYEQALNNAGSSSVMTKQSECSGEQMNNEQWNHEKRSRIEYEAPSNMDRSVMDLLPYQRSGIEMGAVGAVSLTLGLRHSVENLQHQQHTQLQQHEDQIRRQFGGQMVRDFVG